MCRPIYGQQGDWRPFHVANLFEFDVKTVALMLDQLGFPREAFTGVFAIGRMVGWIAHSREQVLEGRLIRPQSRYVGPVPKAA